MPAAVATSSNTTCRTVNTTFINLTTRARAFELSIPSTVTYCCWLMCSIFEICKSLSLNLNWLCKWNVFWTIHLPLSGNFPAPHLHPSIVHHFDTEPFPPYQPWLVWGSRFRSKMENFDIVFEDLNIGHPSATLTWCNSVKSFICSSKRSARYRSPSNATVTSWKSLWTPWKRNKFVIE